MERRKAGMTMQPSCVTRTLAAIERHRLQPEQIDAAILAAINIGLCLESNGDRYVAEGFNHDIVVNGRAFARRGGGEAICGTF
jgi:hypothetical protein